MRLYAYWIGWGHGNASKAWAKLNAGTGYRIVGYYHNRNFTSRNFYIAELKSNVWYGSFDLDVNSDSSPLRRLMSCPSVGRQWDPVEYWARYNLSPPEPQEVRRQDQESFPS